MDQSVIAYVRFLETMLKPEAIVFAHVVPHTLYAAQFFSSSVRTVAEQAVSETLEGYLGRKDSGNATVIVGEGNPMRELLKIAAKNKIDLIVVGLKKFSDGSGVLPRRLIRRAPCPILFAPKMKKPSMNHIWVPVDFSKASARALKYAGKLRQKTKSTRITASHAIYLPAALAVKMSWDQQKEQTLFNQANTGLDKFLDTNELAGLVDHRSIIKAEVENPAASLLEAAKSAGADLIVISPEGQSRIDTLIVGSVTEKILAHNHEIPTLVLK
jgi:nucleotide-binding universal stress UspA family protein